MSEPALDISGLSFSYRRSGSWQLAAISTQVRRGERLAIMGATGAGKSTFAMVCNGLIPHHHEGQFLGSVLLDGVDTSTADAIDMVRKVGLVMQDPETQITGQTVLTDAAVGPANFGLPKDVVLERAQAALELVGMGELGDRDATALSGGQKQRLAIAGIIAMQPDILVLDEPTSELDPQATEEVFAVVKRISADADTALVVIDHEPEIIAEWADRLLVLRDGRVAYDGPPRDFFADVNAVEAAALRAPQVAEVALGLQSRGQFDGPIPVTLDEAVATLPRFAAQERTLPDHAPETEAPIVIDAQGLSHTYKTGVDALRDVTVQIRQGEFVAILGRNGAGKTTFARHLNGLLRPTAGALTIAGKDAADQPISHLALHVGYVFQNPDHQIFAASVREEVAFGLRNQGWDPDRIEARVDAVLQQVGLHALRDRHPFTLGKGQRQRLAVASVLALEPEVLVIDEPTTGQDHVGASSMLQLVEELNQAGHTIVMITHDMTLVAQHARRVLLFAGGQMIADTTPRRLFGDVELLQRGNLVAPQVTRLGAQLGAPDTILTPAEYVEVFVEGVAAHAH